MRPPSGPDSSRAASAVRRVLRWAERALAGMGLSFLVYFGLFDLSFMATGSMSPTLRSEGDVDWVLTEKLSYRFRDPRRWEVATFRDAEGNQLMKRVVALPGETLSLPDVGRLHVNDAALNLPARLLFLRHLPAGNLAGGAAVPAGQGWYVLGDDVYDSLDSRFEGPVPSSRLVGRAWLRVWPPSRIGFVD